MRVLLLLLLANSVSASELNHYFADMHGHTSYSDGAGTPEQAYRYARDVARLDVFILTDHLEQLSQSEWQATRAVAERYNQTGRFVTFAGMEWTTKGGHACFFNPPTKKWPRDTGNIFPAVYSSGSILKICHPGDGKVFNGLAYSQIRDATTSLVEVRSDLEETSYLKMLKLGWHVAPDGSTDSHKAYWGNRTPRHTWTCILSPRLDRRSIWEAIKSRHCYATYDRNCRLSFKINGAVMGDVISTPVNTLHLELTINDPDSRDTVREVKLIGGYTQTKTIPGAYGKNVNVSTSVHIHHARKEETFFYVKVTQSDGDKIWSAPIWFKPR